VSHARYLKHFTLTLLATLGTLACVNVTVDPYDLHARLHRAGLNTVKPAFQDNQKLGKAFAVARLAPQAVIIGTSRSNHALDPDHPGWRADAAPRYNASADGGHIREIARMFAHALAVGQLKQAVIELDPFSFDIHRPPADNFPDDAYLLPGESTWRLLPTQARFALSLSTAKASLQTLRSQDTALSFFEANGRRNVRTFQNKLAQFGGHRKMFTLSERTQYIAPFFAKPQAQRLAFADAGGESSFAHLQQILALARRTNVDLRFYFSPVHARQQELYAGLGLGPRLEDWKRDIVRLLAKEAAAAPGRQAFALWDFSGYNAITTEAVPPLDDATTRMRWHWESSHFTQAAGDLILDRIFDHHDTSSAMPEAFGVALGAHNIEAHLAQIRADRQTYRAAHAGDTAELEVMIASAAVRAR
jgi:hypothetical protein